MLGSTQGVSIANPRLLEFLRQRTTVKPINAETMPPQGSPVSVNEAAMPLSPGPVTADYVTALKNTVLFGASTTTAPDNITYDHVKTVSDPILGDISVYKFSNGMEFYGIQRDDVPLVSYGELIKTGSADETTRTNGVSHFLEHLIFKGTENLAPGEADRILEGLGAGLNAFTWLDETFYYVYDMPRESLGKAIEVWAELLSNPSIPPEELDRERHAVAEEILRSRQDPSGIQFEKLLGSVWPTSRSKWSTLGPMANILTRDPKDGKTHHMTREQILDYFRQFYDPSNRAIVVVGDFDLKETLDTVAHEHAIRPFKGKKTYRSPYPLKPAPVPVDHYVRHDVKVAQLELGFNGPSTENNPAGERKLAALELLSVILGGGLSSRLNKALVENQDNRLATSAHAGVYTHRRDNMFRISAQVKPEQLDDVRQAIRDQIEEVATHGVTERELAKAIKAKKLSAAYGSEEQRNLMSSLAIQIAQGRLEESYGNRIKLHYEEITPDDIQAVAREFLHQEAERSSTLVPRNFPKREVVLKKPALQFAGVLGPKDKSTTLPGGTEVVVREKPGNAMTSVNLLIKGGKRLNSHPGELTVLADMLQRGTSTMTAVELQERLDEEGISFGTEAYGDYVLLTFQSLSEDKDKLMKLVGEVLAEHEFRPKDLALIKDKIQDDFQSTIDTRPPYVAFELLRRELYGENHPYAYGRNSQALVDGLQDITVDQLYQTFGRVFTQPNITVSAVGDVTLDEMKNLAQQWVTPLAESPVEESMPSPPKITEDRVVTQAKEGLHQSEIYRSWLAPDIHDEDRVPLMVLRGILSGGLSARFFQTFREGAEKALCYSVYASYSSKDQGGEFTFYIGTEPSNIRLVLGMFQDEVNKLIQEPVTPFELQRSKLALKSSKLSSAQSTGGVATYLADHRGLGDLSHEELIAEIEKVTPEKLQEVAKKYLSRPSVTAVLAPKAGLEEADLPVNGLAPIQY